MCVCVCMGVRACACVCVSKCLLSCHHPVISFPTNPLCFSRINTNAPSRYTVTRESIEVDPVAKLRIRERIEVDPAAKLRLEQYHHEVACEIWAAAEKEHVAKTTQARAKAATINDGIKKGQESRTIASPPHTPIPDAPSSHLVGNPLVSPASSIRSLEGKRRRQFEQVNPDAQVKRETERRGYRQDASSVLHKHILQDEKTVSDLVTRMGEAEDGSKEKQLMSNLLDTFLHQHPITQRLVAWKNSTGDAAVMPLLSSEYDKPGSLKLQGRGLSHMVEAQRGPGRTFQGLESSAVDSVLESAGNVNSTQQERCAKRNSAPIKSVSRLSRMAAGKAKNLEHHKTVMAKRAASIGREAITADADRRVKMRGVKRSFTPGERILVGPREFTSPLPPVDQSFDNVEGPWMDPNRSNAPVVDLCCRESPYVHDIVQLTEADYRDRESQVALRGRGGSSSLNSNKTDNGFDEVVVSSDSDTSSCERGGLEDPRPVSHQELRHKMELVADSVSSKSNPKSNYNRRKEAVLRKYFDTEALDIDDPGQRSDHELSEEDSEEILHDPECILKKRILIHGGKEEFEYLVKWEGLL